MAIERGGQWQQLPMLMTAHELMHGTIPGDYVSKDDAGYGYRDHADMWARKKFESDERGLTRSIRAEGVRKPVYLHHEYNGEPGEKPTLLNGHHRVAVAADMGPDTLVPVEHTDDASNAHEVATWRRKWDARKAAENMGG